MFISDAIDVTSALVLSHDEYGGIRHGFIRRLNEIVYERLCHGFNSCGMEMQIANHFRTIRTPYPPREPKPITVFYLGDHDPSGHSIQRVIHEKVQRAWGFNFEIRRLAIHAADIETFNLPPQKVKDTDSRSPAFRREHGENASSVELDALPVAVLRMRISDAVRGLIDMEDWERVIKLQKVELDSIAEGTEYMRKLLRRNGSPGATA